MPVIRIRGAAPIAALLIAGCGGSAGNETLPGAANTLPSVLPPGSTAGIEDYLVAGTGSWQIGLEGSVQTAGYGGAVLATALVYDVDLDRWTVNLDGTNHALDANGIGGYETLSCTTVCVGLRVYDNDPATSQYGTFGYGYYADQLKSTDFYTHFGLKTDPADMPGVGTARYAGVFAGSVNYTDANWGGMYDYLDGTANLTATFSTIGGTVAFLSAGSGSLPGSTYSLSGTATISGNAYAGTVTGRYDDNVSPNLPSLQLDPSPAAGTLSGAFYGPGPVETAGIVYATSAPGDPNWGEIAGGFWAGQTSYTP